MHAFNRGFNGQQVGLTQAPKMGPVAMNVGVKPAPAAPILAQGFMAQGQQAVQAPKVGVVAQAPRVAAAPQAAPTAAPTAPGAIPMGSKANCPVCRTFGG